MVDITFDKRLTRFILEAIGYRIDRQGFITERGKRVKSISGEDIRLSEFGGVAKNRKGKNVYIKNDIFDIMKFVDMQESGELPNEMFDLKDIKKVM